MTDRHVKHVLTYNWSHFSEKIDILQKITLYKFISSKINDFRVHLKKENKLIKNNLSSLELTLFKRSFPGACHLKKREMPLEWRIFHVCRSDIWLIVTLFHRKKREKTFSLRSIFWLHRVFHNFEPKWYSDCWFFLEWSRSWGFFSVIKNFYSILISGFRSAFRQNCLRRKNHGTLGIFLVQL